MKNYNCIMTFHDKLFDCEADFKVEECKKSPFTEEYMQNLEEFEREMGKIKSLTFIFDGKEKKKKEKKKVKVLELNFE